MSSDRLLLIGGTGQIGRASVQRLVETGWQTSIVSRTASSFHSDMAEIHHLDRNDNAAIDSLLRTSFDVVVDLVAQRPAHADQLIRNAGSIGSAIIISSAAVYCDDQGLTLMNVSDTTAPSFAPLLTEDSSTVLPSDADYAGRKRAIEIALLDSSLPSTIIRPAAVHGPFSPQPREWFYVRRILDDRRHFVLGYEGRGTLHPASVNNIAEMIALCSAKPGDRILNAGDPGCPNESDIAQAIASAMDADVELTAFRDEPPVASPWSIDPPFSLSLDAAAREVGYRPVETYREAAEKTCSWIRSAIVEGSFEQHLDPRFGGPGVGFLVMSGRSRQPFDYGAEDAALRRSNATIASC